MSREEEVFATVRLLPAAERADYLERECGSDSMLRARIEELLAGYEESQRALATPFVTRGRDALEEAPGHRIGRYKLLQKIGEGGCGIVWMAEQEQPLRRRVALKVIKLGMDTREVIARFEAERQALALMDHPNIAKVFDAGASESGRPYFVMELVRGVPITKYCDELALGTAARLELFTQVCHAVQHAHQKGVIHRDLKPSNILVTLADAGPVPKVIDFGIAKATQGRLADQTIYTSFEQFIGTPAYISPEQAGLSGLDVDTRTDIYSLGVLLYELLTGRTPFDPKELARAGLDEMRRRIRETEPPRPSTRLSTLQGETLALVARHRHAAPPELIHQIRGDLDWIVMRCLEKDRTRRYATANALGEDVLRHLHDEPVSARPPSRVYRFRKLVRRNRLVFAAAGGGVAALVLGVIVASWEAVRAWNAEQTAVQAGAEQMRLRAVAEQIQKKEAAARARAETERQRADAGELRARHRAYGADMQFVPVVLSWSDPNYARTLVERHLPASDTEPDFRGWEWRYWYWQLSSDATGIVGEVVAPHRFAASTDGRWLAVLHGPPEAAAVVVWDLQNRRRFALDPDLRVGIAGETALPFDFAPGAPILAVAASRGNEAKPQWSLVLWNVASGQRDREWPLANLCAHVQYSRDGEQILTWLRHSKGSQLIKRRAADGEQLERIDLPDIPLMANGSWHAIDRDWRYAATCTHRNQLRMVDISTGRELWAEPAEYTWALVFSPDGETFASADFSDHGVVRLRNTRTGTAIGELRGHTELVTGVVFWPDGRTIATASVDHTIRLWDTRTCALKRTLFGLANWRHLVLLSDAKTLVGAAPNDGVALWDTSAPARNRDYVKLGEKFAAWQFASDGHSIVTVDNIGDVIRWRGSDWGERDFRMNVGALVSGWHSRPFVEIADERPLVAVSRSDGTVEVWDWEQQRTVLRKVKASESVPLLAGFIDGGRKLLVNCQIGKQPGYTLCALDTQSGELSGCSKRNKDEIRVSRSPDGRRLIAARGDGWAVLDPVSGVEQRTVPWPQGMRNVTGVSISPDGTLFAATYTRATKILDLRTGEVTTLGGSRMVTFSPDGRRLAATGTLVQSLMLYDVGSWQRVLTLSTPDAGIAFPRFSPDGNVIGVMSRVDGHLFLWRAPSWAEIEAEAKTRAQTSGD